MTKEELRHKRNENEFQALWTEIHRLQHLIDRLKDVKDEIKIGGTD